MDVTLQRGGDWYFPPRPPKDWERVSVAEVGWDGSAVEELVHYCEAHQSEQLLILHGGRILLEHYWQGANAETTADVASVQKSVIGLLLDMLSGAGVLDIDDSVGQWLGQGWSRTTPKQEEALRLRHLMTMTSGLYDDFNFEGAAGTVWYYNNNAYHQLRKVIEVATGQTTQEVFDRLLAAPLGIVGARWIERVSMVDPKGWTLSGFHASARHLARLGMLVLSRGNWKDESLVDGGVLIRSLVPSQELNPSYGQLWWLPSEPTAILPGGIVVDERKSFGGRSLDHPIIPSAPPDLVAAFGAGVKRLYVSTTLGLVVVRLGRSPDSGVLSNDFDEGLWQRVLAAVGLSQHHWPSR